MHVSVSCYLCLSACEVHWCILKKDNLFIRGLAGTHIFLFWSFFIGGLLFFNALLAMQTWFMGYWAEQYEIYPPEQVSVTS